MLLKLTTILVAFLIWAPVAQAWSWPVQGPVLQSFSYDEAHPYDPGQHRGIDIGASATGAPVVAPASGTVSFAGFVPASGESLTIETADGYSVTLTHLGSIGVAEGATVTEGDAVATIGPSGTPEEQGPYVHLGIRLTADSLGYVDPLGLLPAPVSAPPPSAGSGGGVVVPAKPVEHPRRGGLVIRSRPARPTASHETVPDAIPPHVAVARPAVRPRHATTARPTHATEVSRPAEARPVFEPLANVAPAAAPAIRPAQPSVPGASPAGIALAAGPGVLATLVALTLALVRRRRPEPLSATLVAFPSERPLGKAA